MNPVVAWRDRVAAVPAACWWWTGVFVRPDRPDFLEDLAKATLARVETAWQVVADRMSPENGAAVLRLLQGTVLDGVVVVEDRWEGEVLVPVRAVLEVQTNSRARHTAWHGKAGQQFTRLLSEELGLEVAAGDCKRAPLAAEINGAVCRWDRTPVVELERDRLAEKAWRDEVIDGTAAVGFDEEHSGTARLELACQHRARIGPIGMHWAKTAPGVTQLFLTPRQAEALAGYGLQDEPRQRPVGGLLEVEVTEEQAHRLADRIAATHPAVL